MYDTRVYAEGQLLLLLYEYVHTSNDRVGPLTLLYKLPTVWNPSEVVESCPLQLLL